MTSLSFCPCSPCCLCAGVCSWQLLELWDSASQGPAFSLRTPACAIYPLEVQLGLPEAYGLGFTLQPSALGSLCPLQHLLWWAHQPELWLLWASFYWALLNAFPATPRSRGICRCLRMILTVKDLSLLLASNGQGAMQCMEQSGTTNFCPVQDAIRTAVEKP